jgi:hypothetical protein
MMAADIIATAGVAAICFGSLFILPRAWKGWYAEDSHGSRGPRTHGDIALFWWPFGAASRRGAIRGMIPAIAAAWTLLAAGITVRLPGFTNGNDQRVLRIVAITLLGCFAVALALHVCVILFNRPKFIVPPPMRDEPGLLTEHGLKRHSEAE